MVFFSCRSTLRCGIKERFRLNFEEKTGMKMHPKRIFFVGLACLVSTLVLLSGCDSDDGPAETAGKKVDQSVEAAKESATEVGTKVKDAVDSSVTKVNETAKAAGEKLSQGVDSAKVAAQKTGEKVEGALEKTGEKVDETVNKVKGLFQSSEK